MIQFNELRISPDSQHLIIDVSVKDESYYDKVYIDSIVIDNQDTYIGGYPSSNPLYSALTSFESTKKSLRLELSTSDLPLDGLLFVYVRAKGTPSPDTPCGKDNITTLGTVTNMYPFYQQAMDYIGELGNTCSIPKNFIDYILRLKALELSIKTGNYTDAIKFYNKFFGNTPIRKGGCGCGNN